MATLTVLIADDHDGFRTTARRMLVESGLRVVGEAEDGRATLLAAAALRPAVVVLDVRLPDLDGFEVARRLLGANPSAAVVLVSTREAADYGRRIESSGAAGFITKSRLTGDTLLAVVRHHLEDLT